MVASWVRKLGEETERARRRAAMTQEELHEATGISRNSIGHYERGERVPDIETLRTIADAVGASEFQVEEGLQIAFVRERGIPNTRIQADQLSLNFDQDGGVTLRIEAVAARLILKAASA